MRFRLGGWSIALAVGVLSARGVSAQPYNAGNEHYQQTRLANGLNVCLVEDHRVPLVAISLAYPVGRLLDPPEARGAAQVIAQLLPSLPTRHLRGGAAELINTSGFYPWETHATAAMDRTSVSTLVPAGAVDLALFIEAERAGFGAEVLSAAVVARAKNTVLKAFEKESRGPTGDRIAAVTYGPRHPLSTLQGPRDLSGLNVDTLRMRIQRLYSVSGATLSIVGDFDSARLLPVVERTFGALKGQTRPQTRPLPVDAGPPGSATLRSATWRDGFVWAWQTPVYLSPDDITLDVAAGYISHTLAQRLGTPAERASVAARQVSLQGGSFFWLYFGQPADKERSTVEAEARTLLNEMAEGHIDATELEIAKTRIIRETSSRMDGLIARAEFAYSYSIYDGKIDNFGPHLQNYANVDAARLADVVRRHLSKPPATLSVVHDENAKDEVLTGVAPSAFKPPALPEELEQPDALGWYRPPTPIVLPRFDPPRVQESSVGQSRVLFVSRYGLPTVELRWGLNWHGAPNVPVTRELLLDTLLDTRVSGKPRLVDRLSDLGATVSTAQDADSLTFRVTALADHAEAAATAVRETLELEHFDRSTFEAKQADLVKREERTEPSPWDSANRWWLRLAIPKGHRYHVEEVEQSARTRELRKLTLRQLEDFWKADCRAEQLTFAVVGPVDQARAEALARLSLPRFHASGTSKPKPLRIAPGVFLVDDPQARDSLVEISWPMSSWGSPGYVDSLGLRWLFGQRNKVGLSKALTEAGVKEANDWYANTIATRDDSRIWFAVRVAKDQVPSVLRGVESYVAQLRQGVIAWELVDEARREATQWATENFDGAGGYMKLLGAQQDFATPASSGEDLYLLAQRMNSGSLTKAAASLAPEKATVLVYGPTTNLERELQGSSFGLVRVASNSGSAR